MGADGERLQGLFVSIDPERDTPEIMKAIHGQFRPHFPGACMPNPTSCRNWRRRFKIYYKKVAGSTPDTYTMDHSAGSYIFDPQGKVRLYFRYGSGAQAMADDVKKLLTGPAG